MLYFFVCDPLSFISSYHREARVESKLATNRNLQPGMLKQEGKCHTSDYLPDYSLLQTAQTLFTIILTDVSLWTSWRSVVGTQREGLQIKYSPQAGSSEWSLFLYEISSSLADQWSSDMLSCMFQLSKCDVKDKQYSGEAGTQCNVLTNTWVVWFEPNQGHLI